MNSENKEIHETCLKLCRGYVRLEAPIIAQLQLVAENKIYKEYGKKSLFKYAVELCGLSEGVAYSFIAVGKMAKDHPCLQKAVESRTLSVSKANRILSVIDKENVKELVEFAKTHTKKEIEREAKRINPKAVVQAKIKPITGDTDLLQAPIPHTTTENIERAQALLAQKTSAHQGLSETITMVFDEYVERQDPVRKAERAQARDAKKFSSRAEKTEYIPGVRTPLTAAEKHIVDLRDLRQCTYMEKGKRCCDDRWIHYHHIIPVSQGGTNHPDNLTTLCSFHHDLVHRLMEKKEAWLRSPVREYRVS
jgi:hypothetical protein